jgi:hypothetical protein
MIFPLATDKEQRLLREWGKKQGLKQYAHFFRLSRKDTFQAILE